MNEKIKAAVMGGLLLGILSAIPFINIVNWCCCAWVLLGGALAVMFYVKKSQTPVTIGQGAGIGAIAGLIGAIINLIIGLPLNVLLGGAMTGMIFGMVAKMNPEMGEKMQEQMLRQMNLGFGERLLAAIPFALLGFVVIVIFATIGGMIGVAIFEKRKGGPTAPPPPPTYNPQGGYPPQNYGQPGGGGGYPQ